MKENKKLWMYKLTNEEAEARGYIVEKVRYKEFLEELKDNPRYHLYILYNKLPLMWYMYDEHYSEMIRVCPGIGNQGEYMQFKKQQPRFFWKRELANFANKGEEYPYFRYQIYTHTLLYFDKKTKKPLNSDRENNRKIAENHDRYVMRKLMKEKGENE